MNIYNTNQTEAYLGGGLKVKEKSYRKEKNYKFLQISSPSYHGLAPPLTWFLNTPLQPKPFILTHTVYRTNGFFYRVYVRCLGICICCRWGGRWARWRGPVRTSSPAPTSGTTSSAGPSTSATPMRCPANLIFRRPDRPKPWQKMHQMS